MNLIEKLQVLKGTIVVSQFCGVLKAALIPDFDSPYKDLPIENLMVSSGQSVDHMLLKLVAKITGEKELQDKERREYEPGVNTKPFYWIEDPLLKEMLHPGTYLVLRISLRQSSILAVCIEKGAYSHNVIPGFYIQSGIGYTLESAINEALNHEPKLANLSI